MYLLCRIIKQMYWPKRFDLADGWDNNKVPCQLHRARSCWDKFLIEREMAEFKRVLTALGARKVR